MTKTITCPACRQQTLSVHDDGEYIVVACTTCDYGDSACWGVA